jgi:hypothetical protein
MPTDLLLLIMGLTVVEWVLLSALHRRRQRGLTPTQLFVSLAPGFFLVLAFWLSYADTYLPWPAVVCLAIAGLLHAWDLTCRYRGH